MFDIRIENDIDPEELESLLCGFPFASFFNSPMWVRTLDSSFDNFSAFWIAAYREQRLTGAMPVIKIFKPPFYYLRSLPFATYGIPASNQPETRAALIRRFVELSSRAGCLEASAVLFDPDWREWMPGDIPVTAEESRIIDLREDFDYYLSEGMNSTRRKVCRRCGRAGIEVKPLSSENELNQFYGIYRERSRSWGGVHPFPETLFDNLFGLEDGAVVFSGAFLDGRLLGCHVEFYYGNMAQAWISGVSAEGNRHGVPSFLIYHSVRRAYRKGIPFFNLGSSGGDEGLIFFKESLGGERTDFPVVRRAKRWWKWIRKI